MLERFIHIWRELMACDLKYQRPGGEHPRALSHVRRLLLKAYPGQKLRLFVAYDDTGSPGACAAVVETADARSAPEETAHSGLARPPQEALFCLLAARSDAEPLTALIQAMCAYLNAKGYDRLLGPVSPTPLAYGEGIMQGGLNTPPMPLYPYHAPYIADFLERAGFEKARTWVCYRMKSADMDTAWLDRLAARARRDGRLRVEGAPGLGCIGIGGLHGVSAAVRRDIRCVLKGSGLGAAGDAALRLAMRELSPHMRPGLIQIAYLGGEAVGVVMAIQGKRGVCYPILQAVAEKARGRGVLAALYGELFAQIERYQLVEIEMGVVDADNAESLSVLRHIGAETTRQYVLYSLDMKRRSAAGQ